MAPKSLRESRTMEEYGRGLDDESSESPDPTPSTSRIPKLRQRRPWPLRRPNDDAALASTSPRNEERRNANKLRRVTQVRKATPAPEQPPTKKPRRDAREVKVVGSVNEPRGGIGLKRVRQRPWGSVAGLPKSPNPPTQAEKPKQHNPEQGPPQQKASGPKPRSVDAPHARSAEGCEECQRTRRSEHGRTGGNASPRTPPSSSRTSPHFSASSTPTPFTEIKSRLEELVVPDRGQVPVASAGPSFAHVSPSSDWHTQQQPSGNQYTPQPANESLNPPVNPYTSTAPADPTPSSPTLGCAVSEENLVPYLVLGQAGNVNVWGAEAGRFLRPETTIFWVLFAFVAFVF